MKTFVTEIFGLWSTNQRNAVISGCHYTELILTSSVPGDSLLRRETAMIEDSYGGTETDQAFCRKVHLRDLIYLLSWLRKKRRKIIALVFLIRDFISFWRCADIWGKPHYDVPGAEYFLWLRVVGSFCGSLEELASHPPKSSFFSCVSCICNPLCSWKQMSRKSSQDQKGHWK